MKKMNINLTLLFCLTILADHVANACNAMVDETGNIKQSVLATLTRSPQVLMLKDGEKRPLLHEIARENMDCITFGTVEDNERSFQKWVVYSRSLYTLSLLGDVDAKAKLLKEFDMRRRRLEKIDCYADGKPYALCLLGIWNQVASYDLTEREQLISAVEMGRVVPKDLKLASFWRTYNFSFENLK